MQCSATCGGGIRTREVTCTRFSDGLEVNDEICTDIKPDETERCNPEPCPCEYQHIFCSCYTLLKSDVTRRDHVSVVMDPMNAGSRIVKFIVNFIRDGTVFA